MSNVTYIPNNGHVQIGWVKNIDMETWTADWGGEGRDTRGVRGR